MDTETLAALERAAAVLSWETPADAALLRALVERERSGGERAWQPIETAPKDGTLVGLFLSFYGEGWRIADCFWIDVDQRWWMTGRGDFVPYPPTHWMPLPEPPTAGAHIGTGGE